MAVIKKTIQNLKPGKQYLLSVRPKDADLNTLLDPTAAIRFTVPNDATEPTPLGNLIISTNYKSAMISFNPSNEPDLRGYEYKIYNQSQIQQVGLNYVPIDENVYEISGFSSSNVITVDLQQTSTRETGVVVEDIENEELIVPMSTNEVFYYVKVRSVDTSNNYSSWTPVKKSGEIPLIESAHIRELSASKITSGYIGSEQIVLNGIGSVIKSSTYRPEVTGLQATLVSGSTTITLSSGNTSNLYEGMYVYEVKNNPLDPAGNWPGSLGASARITSITSSNQFQVSVPHSQSGVITIGAYAKGWSIDGSGNVNFGGSRGITYDGVNVVIGSGVVIDAVAPEAGGLLVTNGANQSLAINNLNGLIGLKINDTINNSGHNYWLVDGSFKVGKHDKYIIFNAATGALEIVGNVTISSTATIGGTAASTVRDGAASGAGALQAGNGVSQNSTTRQITQISGDRIRTGTIDSNNFSWNGSDTYSTDGSRFDLSAGQIISKSFRIDSSGNASFKGNISGSNISGSIMSGGRVEAGAWPNYAYLGDLGNIGAGHYGLALNDFSNIFLKRWDGAVYFRVDTGSGQYIKFENGTLYIETAQLSVGGGSSTFRGALSGAFGDVSGNFVVKGKLRVGENVDSNSSSIGTTVMRVQGDGSSSSSRYPFVVEQSNGNNIFQVREDGRVEVTTAGSLYVAGTQVSLNGHTHSYASTTHTHSSYLPTGGGTITGNLNVDGNFQLDQVASGTGISKTTNTNVGLLCFSDQAVNDNAYVYWKAGTGSSERFKKNIQNIEDTLENINNFWNLQTVLFEYKEEYGGYLDEERPYNHRKHYGFIAEQVESTVPYLVKYDDDSLTDDVKYNSVLAVLYNEVKKMRKWLMEEHGYQG